MLLKDMHHLSIFNSNNRKLLYIECKLEFRKLTTYINNIGFIPHIKKFYLLFIVIFLLIPLFAISPSAKQDNKFTLITQSFQKESDNSVTFAQPENIIPQQDTISNNKYEKYTLKEGDSISSITARLNYLRQDTITINNPGKEFKAGNSVIIPKEDGLLIGFNKQTNINEIADGLNKSKQDVKLLTNNQEEGYIFIANSNPTEFKKQFDTRLSRSRYNISNNIRVNIAPQYSNNDSSAEANENFSEQLNAFIDQYKGRRHHDGNGWSMGECVSLVKRWQQFIGAAYGIWPGYNGYPRNAWAGYKAGNQGLAPSNATYGVMIISDVNSLKPGDILVIDTPTSHTGIATGKYYGSMYEVFDQNSPVGSAARFTSYSKGSFISALRYYKK
jgi:hypothetical protein